MGHLSHDQFDLFDTTLPLRRSEYAHELPAGAQYLVEMIGLEATISLVKEEGGNELRIPHLVGGASQMWARLVELVGEHAATILVQRCANTALYVPMCAQALRAARNHEIIRRYDAGEPFDSIRRSHKVSRSWLYRLLKKPI